jgi:hypothetical protein
MTTYRKAYEAKWRAAMRARGLCIGGCHQPIDRERSRSYCGTCLDAKGDLDNRRRAERRALGLCRQCGAPANGKAYCPPHLLAKREQTREYRRCKRLGLRRVA